mmetsp:Transcript_14742/g.19062  ORF Transcript_14742/g.19062 Transcript_14742/m.19062 type:complete len:87 (-) Transcript_14742:2626-2886(-)
MPTMWRRKLPLKNQKQYPRGSRQLDVNCGVCCDDSRTPSTFYEGGAVYLLPILYRGQKNCQKFSLQSNLIPKSISIQHQRSLAGGC